MNDTHAAGAIMAVWPEEAIEAIHLAALTLLERAGARVESPAARSLLLKAGCTTADGERVLVPRAAVEQALAACPASYAIAARDAAKSLAMDAAPAQTYVHNMGGARDVSDPRTGASRRATLRDQVRAARIMHHAVNQQQVTSLWQPQDVPDLLEPLYSYLVLAFETDKAIGGPGISHPFQALYLQ
jgi:trimethylamine:corrinoid methyltransferase-like protein